MRAFVRRGVAALVALSVALTGAVAGYGEAAAARADVTVRGGVTSPVFSYPDAVRETVFVESTVDGDGDGARDRLQADVIRPRQTEFGLRVPVIFETSPYYRCCGRGNESEKKEDDGNGVPDFFPLNYDNYFVPRGYAVVLMDSAGTRNSQSCVDMGGPNEIQGAKAVIDWLNGRAAAYRADGSPVRAYWTTGRVGMIGKSWDSAISNGVAATGVEGLTTVVPIGGPTSWYEQHRDGGLPLNWPWPTPVWMFDYVNGRPAGVCDQARQVLADASADRTGTFNDEFWAPRDVVRDADRVRASFLVVHGLNDWNVDPKHFGRWWNALASNGVPRKIWLWQGAHAEPFDFRRAEWMGTLHRWFDYWLHGIDNGIMREPIADIERAPDQWERRWTWPDRAARPVTLHFGPAAADRPGTLSAGPVQPGTQGFTDDPAQLEETMVEQETVALPNRLIYLSPPLSGPVRISGESLATLVARADQPDTNFTVKLVDYGPDVRVVYGRIIENGQPNWSEGLTTLPTETCWGESTATDNACYRETERRVETRPYEIVTRGWLDAMNRDSLREETPLEPGRTYRFDVPIQVEDYVFKPGHRIGVVVAGSDPFWVLPDTNRATTTLELSVSQITLPVVGGRAAIRF